jgi:competence ComEA-like helix-hairpin-helix protein
MRNKLLRELYLLPRGEQRALIIASALLIITLAARIIVQWLPDREPPGTEQFRAEAERIMVLLAKADSLEAVKSDSMAGTVRKSPYWEDPDQSTFSRTQSPILIDINRADSIQLLPLPGIGPVFAGRIIKYRDLLGGFLTVDQLREVYGMPEETVELIRDMILIDTTIIRKIFLDSAGFKELLRHPYLEYNDVRTLLQFRDFTGNIQSKRELRENYILPDSTLERVSFYFDYR